MGRASVIVRSDADRILLADWAYRVPVGTRVDWRGPRRRSSQNDLMWARLTDLSRQLDWYGQKLKPEDWKDMFTASLKKARVVPGLDPGSFVPLGMRTSEMSEEEMSDLLTLIEAFAAERGVTFNEEEAA